MEETKRNIDKILLNKAYNELSAEEFLVVKKEISSESEYNDLRAMLIAASNELANVVEIEPKAATKNLLMKEFTRVHPAIGSRAGGLGFLFPKGRSFYQQPGYQLIAVAAVIILIFTIYPRLTGNMTSDNEVAQHNVKQPEEIPTKTQEDATGETTTKDIPEIEATEKEIITEEFKTVDQTIAGTTEVQKSEAANGDMNYTSSDLGGSKDKEINYDGTLANINEISNIEEAPVYAPESLTDEENNSYYWDSAADSDDAVALESTLSTGAADDLYKVSENNSSNGGEYRNTNELDANAGAVAVDSEFAMAEQEEVSDEIFKVSANKNIQKSRADKKSDASDLPIKKVKSLSENAELIDLFYTAM